MYITANNSKIRAMNFWTAVINCLLLHHWALLSEGSFLKEQTLADGDNLLTKFLAGIKPRLEAYEPWDIAVIGESNDQLDETKVLLGASSGYIGRDVTGICASYRVLSTRTFMIYFLAGLGKEYLTKAMRNMFVCKRFIAFIIFEAAEMSDSDIELVLRTALEEAVPEPIFIHNSKQSVKLYAYDSTADCSRKVRLLRDWMPGDDLQVLTAFFSGTMHSGCYLTVGTRHRPPWINLAEDGNGMVRIVGGLEGELISTIAQGMNLIIRAQDAGIYDNNRILAGHTLAPICATGNADICIGHIRPESTFMESVDISSPYGKEIMVWCVPHMTHERTNIMTFEFSWSTWLVIGLTFLTSFWVDRIVRRSHPLNGRNVNRSGYGLIILDLIGSTLGNPIIYNPISIGGKLLLISYLLYSTVITTAYKTSLSSMLTVNSHVWSIENVEGIIRANLTPGGNAFALAILEDQRGENPIILDLIRRFTIEQNITKALRRVSNDKDFAYVVPLTQLIYNQGLLARAGESISIHVLEECILAHEMIMVFRKSSYLERQVNDIINRLAETGLLRYWERKYLKPAIVPEITDIYDQTYAFIRNKLYSIFCIYCLAMIFCILIFSAELIFHKFELAGAVGRFNNSIRVKVRRFMPV